MSQISEVRTIGCELECELTMRPGGSVRALDTSEYPRSLGIPAAEKNSPSSGELSGAWIICRVSWDQRVTPPDAARFLGVTERTLRRLRDQRRGPRAVYRPLWGYTWSYELQELYEFNLFSALGQNGSRYD